MEISNFHIEAALEVLGQGAVSPIGFMRKCGERGVSYASALEIAKSLLGAGIIHPTIINGRIIAYRLNESPEQR